MNFLEEKYSSLSRVGSFYSKVLQEDEKKKAYYLAQMPFETKQYSYLSNISDLLRGECTYPINDIILNFKDADVYAGPTPYPATRSLLESGVSPITLTNQVAVQDNDLNIIGVNSDRFSGILFFNKDNTLNKPYLNTTNFQGWMVYIGENVWVHSIKLEDGSILYEGLDFYAYFGSIYFNSNPLILFPNFNIYALNATKRNKNIFAYTLNVNTYGAVNRIFEYYRGIQSIENFILAAAQASGFYVTNEAFTIINEYNYFGITTFSTSIGPITIEYPYYQQQLIDTSFINKNTILGNYNNTLVNWEVTSSNVLKITLDQFKILPYNYIANMQEFLYREKPIGLNMQIVY